MLKNSRLLIIMFCLPVVIKAQSDNFVQTSGDLLLYTLPASAASLTWYHHDQDGFEQFCLSGALTVGTTYLLKHTINAKRPDGEDHSFPSGHSSGSFFAAEFIRKRYGWQWGAPAYVAATFVAYSRVSSKKHYVRDVIAGAAIGIIYSAVVTKSYDEKTRPGDPQIAGSSLLTMSLPLYMKGWNMQTASDGRHWRIAVCRNW